MVTIGRAINSHTASNVSGLKIDVKLRAMCRVKNRIRKIPEMLMMSFFPIEEVNMFAIVIL
jgi:hypothetical protein